MATEDEYADGFIDFGDDAIFVGESDEPMCRVCHCTQSDACVTEHGTCVWVSQDLCSACAQTHEA